MNTVSYRVLQLRTAPASSCMKCRISPRCRHQHWPRRVSTTKCDRRATRGGRPPWQSGFRLASVGSTYSTRWRGRAPHPPACLCKLSSRSSRFPDRRFPGSPGYTLHPSVQVALVRVRVGPAVPASHVTVCACACVSACPRRVALPRRQSGRGRLRRSPPCPRCCR